MKAQQAPGRGQLALVGRLKAPRESTLPEGARVWVTVLDHEPWAGSFSPGEERQDRAAELGAGPGCEREWGPPPGTAGPATVEKTQGLSRRANAPRWGTPPGVEGNLRESQLEVCHSLLSLCPQIFPHPQPPPPWTGISWKGKVAVVAIFHILIMNSLCRTHRK